MANYKFIEKVIVKPRFLECEITGKITSNIRTKLKDLKQWQLDELYKQGSKLVALTRDRVEVEEPKPVKKKAKKKAATKEVDNE